MHQLQRTKLQSRDAHAMSPVQPIGPRGIHCGLQAIVERTAQLKLLAQRGGGERAVVARSESQGRRQKPI
jgi:hypothetical protein